MHLWSKRASTHSSKHKLSRSSGLSARDENDDVSELLSRVEEARTYSVELAQRFHKQCKSRRGNVEDMKKTGETVTALHSKSTTQHRDGHLQEALLKTRDFQINVLDLDNRLTTGLESKIAVRVAEFVKDEAVATKNARKNFIKAKTAYDSLYQQSKKEKGAKKVVVEQELAGVKEEYATIGNLTMNMLVESNKELDLVLLRALCDYWDAYTDFFTKGFKWVNNMQPVIERYREHLNLEQEELDKRKKDENTSKSLFKVTGETKVFGTDLEELCTREGLKVPKFLKFTCSWIEKNASEMEGIFRISSFKDTMEDYKRMIDEGWRLDYSEVADPHVVPGLLKLFLREMPEPLLTFPLYRRFINCNKIDDDARRMEELKSILQALPSHNRASLKCIVSMLSKVADNQSVTKMGATNLATVIGPNILYDKELDPLSMVEDMENSNSIIVSIISNYASLFRTTSIVEAAREADIPTMLLLHRGGQAWDATDPLGNTCLHVAALQGSFELTEFLLKQDAAINARNNEGMTPLMMTATQSEATQILAVLLINKGADPDIKNNKNQTIWDLARKISPDFLSTLEMEYEELLAGAAGTAAEGTVAKTASEPSVATALAVPSRADSAPSVQKSSLAVESTPGPEATTPGAPEATESDSGGESAGEAPTPAPPAENAGAEAEGERETATEAPATPAPPPETPAPPQAAAEAEVEKTAATEEERERERAAEKTQAEASVVPATTAAQEKLSPAERAAQKAQAMLQSRLGSKAAATLATTSPSSSPSPSPSSPSPAPAPSSAVTAATAAAAAVEQAKAEAEVEDLIFERVRSFNNIVKTAAPLPSVYALINMDELASSSLAVVSAAVAPNYGSAELKALQDSLKLIAGSLKGLFLNVKKFASLFDLQEKKEVLSNALALQSTVRSLIGIVKDVSTDSGDAIARASLLSNCQQYADTITKFYKACEGAGIEHAVNATNACMEAVGKMLQAADLDALNTSVDTVANACVKLGQLVNLRMKLSSSADVRKQMETSMALVERGTLELVNDCKRAMASTGSASNEELANMVKKLMIEFKNIVSVVKRDPPVAALDKGDQKIVFQQISEEQQQLLARLRSVTFAADLDKALVLQYLTISNQFKLLSDSFDTMSETVMMGVVTKLIDAVKKIKVGVNAISSKSRDVTLKRELLSLADALANYLVTLRLSACIQALDQTDMALPFYARLQGVDNIATKFFEELLQLRGL